MNAIAQQPHAFADFYATAEGSIASSHGTQAQVWFSYEHSADGFHYILAVRRLENGDWSRMGFTLAVASPLTQQRVVEAWREAEEDQEWETVDSAEVPYNLMGMESDELTIIKNQGGHS